MEQLKMFTDEETIPATIRKAIGGRTCRTCAHRVRYSTAGKRHGRCATLSGAAEPVPGCCACVPTTPPASDTNR